MLYFLYGYICILILILIISYHFYSIFYTPYTYTVLCGRDLQKPRLEGFTKTAFRGIYKKNQSKVTVYMGETPGINLIKWTTCYTRLHRTLR